MMKLEQILRNKVKRGSKIVCAYLTLGYPSFSATERLIVEFEKAGVDLLELGFPFSDPMADGPTIQKASDHALKQRITLKDAFSLVLKLRRKGLRIPIVFFSYYNPIFHHGLSRTASDLKRSGFQGAIIPDLPPQEGEACQRALASKGLALAYLIAPTTNATRMKTIAKASDGFIYYVSLRGVTGARTELDPQIMNQVKHIKKITSKPVLVGFGVSTSKHVKKLCRFSDGVIVGSAIINQLAGDGKHIKRTAQFVKSLVRAARSCE